MGNGVGTGAANKMTALFFLLKSGEIKKEPVAKVATAKATTSHPKISAKKKNTTEQTRDTVATNEHQSVGVSQNRYSRPDLHIDLQIHISPDSTPEQIDTIFASMAKHLYGVNNE